MIIVVLTASTRVLVLVKASPQPSQQYGDTVCVAGVDLAARDWVRLYPVPFRYLDGDQQFKKYDIIRVLTRDAGADKRPESRKIDASRIDVEGHLNDWRRRSPWVEPLVRQTMCDVVSAARADLNASSLAAIRPGEVRELRIEPHEGWSASELAKLNAYRDQGDLFDLVPPRVLEPPQFTVHLDYKCESEGCVGHSQRIIDWELTALQARYRTDPVKCETAIRRNFYEIPFADRKSPLLFVGNQENVRRRASFTVLGIYYPNESDIERTQTLF